MVTGRGDKGDALPEREIILQLPIKNKILLSQIFKENTKIPATSLKRKLGRRQYDNFKEIILEANNFLSSKGLPYPFLITFEEIDGRISKFYMKNIQLELEQKEKSLFAMLKT